jgi:hypothetical protein
MKTGQQMFTVYHFLKKDQYLTLIQVLFIT